MKSRIRQKHTLNYNAFLQSIILLGFICLLAWLDISKQLPLYINPKFSLLTEISCLLLIPMFVIQLRDTFIPVHSDHNHSCCHCNTGHGKYLPFFIVLILAFAFPENTLKSSLVNSKGLNSQINIALTPAQNLPRPLAETFRKMTLINITNLNYSEAVYEITQYPHDYIGKKVTMTGFIFRSPGLANNQLSLVRYVIACCTADSLPYGLMCETISAQKYSDGTWLSIEGIVTMSQYQNKAVPAIKITSLQEIKEPKDPYIFPYDL